MASTDTAHAFRLYRASLRTLRTAHVHELRLNCLRSAEKARRQILIVKGLASPVHADFTPHSIRATGTPARAQRPAPLSPAMKDRLAVLRASWAPVQQVAA